MGAGASVNDVASHVKGHGSAYNYIAAAIEENGVDGEAILAYDGPESILDDLKVKKLHRNQLTRDYALLGCDLSEKELTELKQDSLDEELHFMQRQICQKSPQKIENQLPFLAIFSLDSRSISSSMA